jgi:amino acid transporter
MATSKSVSVLTVYSLAMLTIGSVAFDCVRNLPASAMFQGSPIFFYILAGVAFLIPTALVSAELASAWPSRGSIYTWIKQAFGVKWALLAVWYQWIGNVFWYPTVLSFIAGTLAHITMPELIDAPAFMVSVILVVFWSITALNLLGLRVSAWFGSFCTVIGLVIPLAIIIGLGIAWLIMGNPSQMSVASLMTVPSIYDPTAFVAVTAIILSCCGMEITSAHAPEVDSPQRDYPRALFISATVIMLSMILGYLAIAIVVPKEKISLVAGLIQAFDVFFTEFHLQWLLPVFGGSILLGALGGLSNWVIGPSKGFLFALQDLQIAPFLHKENSHRVPVTLLIFQGIVCTAISLIFFLMPSTNSSYWVLTVLASQLYLVMYVILFLAVFYLRVKFPHVPRAYKIPGGKIGLGIVCTLGLISCIATIIIGFYPPADMHLNGSIGYTIAIFAGFVLFSFPAYLLYRSHTNQKVIPLEYVSENM